MATLLSYLGLQAGGGYEEEKEGEEGSSLNSFSSFYINSVLSIYSFPVRRTVLFD